LVGFGDRARAALGHAPGHPSMEMPVHVSRSRGGRTFLDAALAMGLSQRRQVSLTLPGRLPRAPASCSCACARPRSLQTEPVFRARRLALTDERFLRAGLRRTRSLAVGKDSPGLSGEGILGCS
jgi:hypothetical protein